MELQKLIDGLKAHKSGAAAYESVDEAIRVFEAMRDVDGEKVVKGLERFRADFKPFVGNSCDWERVDAALTLIRQQQARIVELEAAGKENDPRIVGLHNEANKKVHFILDGCDISFGAEAPADMTLAELLKQCDRIQPDWCACGIRSYDPKHDYSRVELSFDYDDVRKVYDPVSCRITPKEEEHAAD